MVAGVVRAKKPKHLPVVLTRSEVDALLAQLQGDSWIVANLLYGAGLRLLEALRLRVKDVDFTRREIIVRDGKGQKDRVTMLPMRVVEPLRQHLNKVQRVHQGDLAEGFGEANLPFALARKYPNAAKEWGWQFVFPSGNRSQDPRGHGIYRHHLHEKPSRGRCVRRRGVLAWSSMRRHIRYVIPLPRIFWRQARTFAPCRSCSATQM
ncbi:integrase [Pseudomonas sp. 3400]|nr:integrase [Pseudomonas sp. 3400]MDR7014062.1 integrase [Pseudomonas alcaliphila]